MVRSLLGHANFEWIDVTAPTHEELRGIAERYGFHLKLVEDCLDPEHLPKFEPVDGKSFLITRTYDPSCEPSASTVREMTRKIAVFFGPDFFITVHRVPLPLIDTLAQSWGKRGSALPGSVTDVLADCLNEVISSYEPPLTHAEEQIEKFEQTLFANREIISHLKDIHVVKSRLSVYRRMLWHTMNTIQKMHPQAGVHAPLFQDMRENAEAMYLYGDELLEDINSLLHIHLGMASHRTNEVVRVLTLFSVFFMPLTFIAGIYGMNFRHMPELEWSWGYPGTLVAMAIVSAAIFGWFKHRGFFR